MPLLWTPSHVIADITLPGNATNIDVTGLNYNNDGPWQIYIAAHNPLGGGTYTYLYFNADYTIANYQAQSLYATGGSHGSTRYNEPRIDYLIAGASSIALGTIMIDAADYARYRGVNCRKVADALDIIEYGMCKDDTVANITSLRVASFVANGLGAGTRLILTRIAH